MAVYLFMFTPLDLYVHDDVLTSLDVTTFVWLLSSSALCASAEATHYGVVSNYILSHTCSDSASVRLLGCIRWIHVSPIYLRDLLLYYSVTSEHIMERDTALNATRAST